MYRVCYVVSTLENTGPTNQLFNIIRHLNKNEFTPLIVTLSSESVDSMWSKFEEHGIDVRSLSLSRVKGVFCIKRKLFRLLSEEKIDVVHTQGIRADFLLSNSKYRSMLTIRNIPNLDYPNRYGYILGNLMARIHLGIIKKSKFTVACSFSVQKILKEFNKSIKCILNGVDTQKYSAVDQEKKQKLRRKLNIPLDRIVFISAAPLIKRKNYSELIRSFQAAKLGDKALLFILGDGPEKKELCSLAMGNIIELRGKVENVAEYLQCADVFVSTSIAEGMPNAVLEAIAVGLPVVLSNNESHLELMQSIKLEQATYQLYNEEDLINKIRKIYNDVISQSIDYQGAVANLRHSYGADAMSASYQKLYKEIISRSY